MHNILVSKMSSCYPSSTLTRCCLIASGPACVRNATCQQGQQLSLGYSSLPAWAEEVASLPRLVVAPEDIAPYLVSIRITDDPLKLDSCTRV